MQPIYPLSHSTSAAYLDTSFVHISTLDHSAVACAASSARADKPTSAERPSDAAALEPSQHEEQAHDLAALLASAAGTNSQYALHPEVPPVPSLVRSRRILPKAEDQHPQEESMHRDDIDDDDESLTVMGSEDAREMKEIEEDLKEVLGEGRPGRRPEWLTKLSMSPRRGVLRSMSAVLVTMSLPIAFALVLMASAYYVLKAHEWF